MKWQLVAVAGTMLLTAPLGLSQGHSQVAEVVDVPSRTTSAMQALALLADVTPQQGDPPSNARVKQDQYILWGELFEKGRIGAVVELSDGDTRPTTLALAVWNAGKWKIDQVIEIPVFWKVPSIPADQLPHLPKNLPTKAFWTLELDPAAAPFLAVSTGHSRYRSALFILTYDRTTHRLVPSPERTVKEPSRRGPYVVLTNDSGNKARWGDESYYEVEKGALQFRGMLRTGSMQGDDRLIHVTFHRAGVSHATTWCFTSRPANQADYIIQKGDDVLEPSVQIGTIRFLQSAPDFPHAHEAYLLSKLTGLPPTLTDPEGWKDGKYEGPAPPMPADRDVQVTGDDEVVRLLGPSPANAAKPKNGK